MKDYHNITLIRAGAGSGKTFRITGIVEEAIREGTCRPEALIATTFTRKAAAELQERLRTRLYSAGLNSEAGRLGGSLIGTVHSISERLLRQYWHEAGISPEIEVLDEQSAAGLLAQALDEVASFDRINRLQESALRLEQLDSRTRSFNWRRQVMQILDAVRANGFAPDQLPGFAGESAREFLDIFGPPATSETRLNNRLLEAVSRARTTVSAWGDGTKKTRDYLSALEDFAERFGSPGQPWKAWMDLCGIEPAKRGIPEAVKSAVEAVREAAEEYRHHPKLHEDIRFYTAEVFALAAEALSTYQALKEERGYQDFTDLEQRALALLRSSEDFRANLATTVDLMVVDEFQDTSPLQLALFLELARCAKRVFWVGDVKQAIYGFRNSDPQLIDAVVRELEKRDGLGDPLNHSYRSVPDLVNFSSSLFPGPFRKTIGLSREDVELAPVRDPIDADQAAIEAFNLCNGDIKGRFTIGLQHSALASGIRQLLDREPPLMVCERTGHSPGPLQPGDIAILCRTNDRAAGIAEALGAQEIPTSIAGPGLLATPEAALAMACLRRMADPFDTLATAEIIALTGNRVPEEWLADRLHYVAEHERSKSALWGLEGKLIEPRLQALDKATRSIRSASISEAVDIALEKGDVMATATAWGPGPERAGQRRANLEALRTLAARYEEQCLTRKDPATISGFLTWCGDLSANGTDMKAASPGGDSVEVLTYHRAKGLEWPVVICTQLDHSPRLRYFDVHVTAPPPDTLSFDNPLAERRIRFWPSPFGNKSKGLALLDDIANSTAAQEQDERIKSEELRLLYVGFTRARDCLALTLVDGKDHPWLDQVSLSGHLFNSDHLTLPDGQSFRCRITDLEPAARQPESRGHRSSQHWFAAPVDSGEDHPPARIIPSSVKPTASARIGAVHSIGGRLPINGKPDENILGDAVHAILAAELNAPGHPTAADLNRRILVRHGLTSHLDPEQVTESATGFRQWVLDHFKPATTIVECPFHFHNPAGQIVSGYIDLLLETPSGWIIIDHKSWPGARNNMNNKALEFSGQLHTYAMALYAAGRKCAGTYIHFPVIGTCLEITLPDSQPTPPTSA